MQCSPLSVASISRRRAALVPAWALCACLLAGCAPIVRTHGSRVDADRLAQIQPGVSRQADVAALLGTPSAEGTFDPNAWYYITQRTEQRAFFAPKLVERTVLRVTFDPATGAVQKVEKVDPKAAVALSPVSRKTPTAGHNLTFMEQVIGNVGRFNKKDDK